MEVACGPLLLEDPINVKSISPIAGYEPQANRPLDFASFKSCEETYTYLTGELGENDSRLGLKDLYTGLVFLGVK